MADLPDTRTIPLTQGRVAIVDAEDYERMARFKWCALLPCPFCGGEAVLTEHPPHEHGPIMKRIMPDFPDHAGSWDASCANCDCGHLRDTEAEATAAWNRRTPPTPATDEREAVARAINPGVWASFDGSIRPYTENRGANASTDSAHFYERSWRAGCRTPDDVRRWWLETADTAKESTYVLLLRDSLTKADAALSALAPVRAQEIAAARAEEQGYRHTQVAALKQVHAAEILAAEAMGMGRARTVVQNTRDGMKFDPSATLEWRNAITGGFNAADLALRHELDAMEDFDD